MRIGRTLEGGLNDGRKRRQEHMGDRWGSASGPGCGVLLPERIGASLRWKHDCRTGFGSDGDLDTVEQRKVVIDLKTWRCVRLVPINLRESPGLRLVIAGFGRRPNKRFRHETDEQRQLSCDL